ncbi:MAG: 2-C-methyl-D-erythritol 4-phosphate cytidylyltransferase [Candidatus Methylacidiphilales bacterium]|nr:2-C-methyl-D-erythritol 4-phosphate cytidylyltransferase [Candidatus Methylacidiphilales bacterium]
MNDCSAVLLAGGASRRLGFDKILSPLAGKPVLAYSLEALDHSPSVSEIVLVAREDTREAITRLAGGAGLAKPWRVVTGGVERQDSVWNGIQATSATAMVLIHDAARPLLTPGMVADLVAATRESGAVICGRPATDTLKLADSSGWIESTVDRSKYWQVETPQVFRRDWIERAYREVQEQKVNVTDDASAVERLGLPVRIVTAGAFNLKITRPADWQMLELWLSIRTGSSLRAAVHALANQASPLLGYLPLLQKYGSTEPKFIDYWEKCLKASEQIEEQLRVLQEMIRSFESGKGN